MIRLMLLIILFLVSLLCFLKAPEYHLWLLAIGVTEFPFLFVLITGLITATGLIPQRFQLAGTVLGLITILIYLSPVIRSYSVAKDIKQDMAKALGIQENNETP